MGKGGKMEGICDAAKRASAPPAAASALAGAACLIAGSVLVPLVGSEALLADGQLALKLQHGVAAGPLCVLGYPAPELAAVCDVRDVQRAPHCVQVHLHWHHQLRHVAP